MNANTEWSTICAVSVQIRDADRRRVEAERKTNATPETLRRLRSDTALRMLERGKLTNEQWQAANEILRVFTALTAGLLPRVSDLSRVPGRSLLDDWPAGLRKAASERYNPWRNNAALTMVAHRTTLADLVFMVVVDNYTHIQVGKMLGLDYRNVLAMLRESLWDYAWRSGWMSGHIGLANKPVAVAAE